MVYSRGFNYIASDSLLSHSTLTVWLYVVEKKIKVEMDTQQFNAVTSKRRRI